MTHYGLICPGSTGHLNTMLPLGRELQKRGHRITLFGTPFVQPKAEAAGFNFRVIGETEWSPQKATQFYTKLGELSGMAAVKYTMNGVALRAEVSLRDTPKSAKEDGVEALLVDQICFEGESIAKLLKIPFITVCSAVVINQEDTIPPYFANWSYNLAWWARLRNLAGYSLFNRINKPVRQVISEYRQKWNLPSYSSDEDLFSKLAIISQEPAELEFPRNNLPQCFHFTGPYHDSTGRPAIDFPFDKLTGQPLIYASMGTLQNRLLPVFQKIATACQDLDAQLVISLGGSADPEVLQGIPGNPLVVRYAPQLQLLEKVDLTITHAGLNTTLECLINGVPMVAIPVTNDQPGVASRIVWSGCGEAVPVKKVNVNNLRTAINKVLTEDSYKKNALRLQAAIKKAGGVKQAVDIVEQAVSGGKPVLAQKN
ncbi:glycosyltransferase [Anabaena cylindrica FACHB-243]|uniref:Glycosyltransferase, MGT family n=1 Tax=Anabaena cylindrica (strain ATCC 27899 / PCC 7122) TaxID=272123 RepID=K9ZA97_ANACC|nr:MULTISPECIES: glycosyltransferase [Anabaena]AFZ56123.1 glycosyltransferase, MGT family [Anabaena cylindrica PCC 7122]MBD2417354.1 glycosyltransferase [Anabaena cylindrica FACHB-243]MBY5282811.1 glycosyltransferase [Anabaena sp. CCAP 1446/1C]MBY5310770.1 glycosyltransferase [Anabaena sp. CCAP 1446/1C]MCM2404435.1 glycosyltransferase [Anabaena sp. CCAP 1446/1C]